MAWACTALAHGPARPCQAWAWVGHVMGEAWVCLRAELGRGHRRGLGGAWGLGHIGFHALSSFWACGLVRAAWAWLARHGLGHMGLRAPAELGRGLR